MNTPTAALEVIPAHMPAPSSIYIESGLFACAIMPTRNPSDDDARILERANRLVDALNRVYGVEAFKVRGVAQPMLMHMA